MATVSIRDLRNHGGEIVDRVQQGESLIVTRDGRPVAELRPLRRKPLNREALLERWRNVPTFDYADLRREIDQIIDPSL